MVQGIGQADGDGGFPFAGRRGVDGGDQHQPPLFFGQFECVGRIDFGFVFAVMLQLVGLQAQFFGNLVDVPDIGGLCDFYVRLHVAAPLKIHHADKNVGHCSVFPCAKAACTSWLPSAGCFCGIIRLGGGKWPDNGKPNTPT